MKNKYRIVTDSYNGFEVQVRKRFLLWTWWVQCRRFGYVNSFKTITEAQEWIYHGLPELGEQKQKVVWTSTDD